MVAFDGINVDSVENEVISGFSAVLASVDFTAGAEVDRRGNVNLLSVVGSIRAVVPIDSSVGMLADLFV